MYPTVHDAFLASLAQAPSNAYFCVPPGAPHEPDGLEWTYSDVNEKVRAEMSKYGAAGFGPGHRVALLLENRPDHFVHFLALNALGVSVVPVNPELRPGELKHLLEHSESDLVVCRGRYRMATSEVAAVTRKQPPVVDVDASPERLPSPQVPALALKPDPSSEAMLLYTSGTTGRPKGCVLTNEYLLRYGQWYVDFGSEPGSYFKLSSGERMFNPLPVFHLAVGCLSFISMTLTQGCLIMSGRFSATRWWRDIVATRATVIHCLALIPAALMNQPVTAEERNHKVKWALLCGIEPTLHAAFEARFGVPGVDVWGMTEVGAFFADDHEPRKIGQRAFGKPIRGYQVRIVDDEEADVPIGTPGQLLVRNGGADPRDGFFAGYLNDAEATEVAWRGGWFHTGDVVRQDEDGTLYFVDRKKNIIRRSGENISAGEIEAVLQADPDVAYAAVIPVLDEIRQEEVYACVVVQPGVRADGQLAKRLFKVCFESLAHFKAPGWLMFLDALPLTDTQKVQKQKVFAANQDPRALPGVFDFRALKREDAQLS